MSNKLSCSVCGKIHINKDVLIEELETKLWVTATDGRLFKIANILLGTNYSLSTHCFSDGQVCPNGSNLKIIKTIESSKNLTKEEKQDIIGRILRIYESSDERDECLFKDDENLSSAFLWQDTREGHNYWSFIDRRLRAV